VGRKNGTKLLLGFITFRVHVGPPSGQMDVPMSVQLIFYTQLFNFKSLDELAKTYWTLSTISVMPGNTDKAVKNGDYRQQELVSTFCDEVTLEDVEWVN
jgi:hypothetical protein